MATDRKLVVLIVSLIYHINAVTANCVHEKFYSHPTDCRLFHQCSHGVLYEHSCPAELHFNLNTSRCDYPSNVNCELNGSTVTTPKPPESTTPESTTPSSTTAITRPPACDCDQLYASPDDCQIFYRCSNGVLYEQSCPNGLYFNPNTSVCDYPSRVNCKCKCGESYPNPTDCQWFYRCAHGILYAHSCPDGLYFNSNTGVCDHPSNVNCDVISPTTRTAPPAPTTPTTPTTPTSQPTTITPNTTTTATTKTPPTTTTTQTTTTTTTPTPINDCTDFCGNYAGE